jgi:hypothetical protein
MAASHCPLYGCYNSTLILCEFWTTGRRCGCFASSGISHHGQDRGRTVGASCTPDMKSLAVSRRSSLRLSF